MTSMTSRTKEQVIFHPWCFYSVPHSHSCLSQHVKFHLFGAGFQIRKGERTKLLWKEEAKGKKILKREQQAVRDSAVLTRAQPKTRHPS